MSIVATQLKSKQASLFSAFQETAARMGERVALKGDGGKGQIYTYRGVTEKVKRVAEGLGASEFAQRDRVGLLSENRPEWVVAYLAILAAGKTVVPIDANLKSSEIGNIVEDAKLDLIFVSGAFEKLLHTAYPHTRLLSFEEDSANSWTRIEKPPSRASVEPNEAAVLIYTSGTTGAPKVVVLTHRNLLANLEGVEDALRFGPSDVFLSVLPLHHTFEATCGFITPLISGATIVYARSLKSKQILEDLGFNRATLMCGVPLLFEKMYHSIIRKVQESTWPRRLMFNGLLALSGIGWRLGFKWGRGLFRSARNAAGIGTIRMLVSGGAPLPPEIARFFNLFGIDFLQGYGLTECSPVVSVNRPDDIEFGSIGVPLSNLQIRIFEPDETGVGEILVKGDSVMAGYLNNPGKTAEVLRDGWFHTGDLGHFRKGHLWITGRKKNVIVSAAGKNIYPEELEERLLASPYVLEAVVFGRKKEARQGEEIRAIIVPDLEQVKADWGEIDESPTSPRILEVIGQVVTDLNEQMADFKRIKGFEVQFEEFEKTSTKKIKRFAYLNR